jgi:hypothetical protein
MDYKPDEQDHSTYCAGLAYVFLGYPLFYRAQLAITLRGERVFRSCTILSCRPVRRGQDFWVAWESQCKSARPCWQWQSKNVVGQSTGIENQPTDQGRICVYGYGIEKSETKEEHVRGPACQYQPAWSRSAWWRTDTDVGSWLARPLRQPAAPAPARWPTRVKQAWPAVGRGKKGASERKMLSVWRQIMMMGSSPRLPPCVAALIYRMYCTTNSSCHYYYSYKLWLTISWTHKILSY